MIKFFNGHWKIIYSILLIWNLIIIVEDIMVQDTMGVFINVAFSAALLYYWNKNK